MRNRREAIALGILLAALVAIALLVRTQAGDAADDDPRHSTFLPGPNGARALYLLAAELDLPAARHLTPWVGDLPDGALVVLAPHERPTPREIDTLLAWVDAGGTLVWGASAGRDSLAQALGLHTVPLRPAALTRLEAARWTGAPAYPEPHEWTADVTAIEHFRRGFHPASPALTRGAVDVLLRTRAGVPTAVRLDVGGGSVIAFSDPAVLSNQRLRAGDAALLFVRAATAALAEGGALHFDEYHQGYRAGGGPVSALRRFVATSGWGRALAQAAVAALLLLLYAGARLGSPLRETAGRRRSQLEHVDALATAYRRAGARRTARRLILAGLERRLGRRAATGALQPSQQHERTTAAQRLQQEWHAGDGGSIVALAGAVDDYVNEVHRWQ
jgi:hypothetical protein